VIEEDTLDSLLKNKNQESINEQAENAPMTLRK